MAGIPSNSPLLNPSQTLVGQPLYNAAKGIANSQVQGPLTELAKQVAQNRAQGPAQKQTFGYFMTLAQQAKADLAQTQAQGTNLNSQLGQIGANAQSQLAQFGQQAQGGALGRMTAQGLDGGSSQALAAETARQQGLGALNAGAFQAAGANQGANYNSNAASNLGTFALAGQERLGDIGRATQLANAPLASKQAALIASRGALTSTALGQLRTAERNYQVAQEGIGVKTANIAATNQRSANTIAAANARNAATNNQQNIDNLRNNQTKTALAGGAGNAKVGKPATGGQANTIFAHIDYLSGLFNQLVHNGVPPVNAYHLLQNGGRVRTGTTASGTPTYKTYPANRLGASVLNAAYNTRSGCSGLTPGDLAWLKSVGIVNPTRYARQTSRVGSGVTGSGNGAGGVSGAPTGLGL